MSFSRCSGRGALKSSLFYYAWVHVPCKYSSGSITDLVNGWKQWTSDIPTTNIFLRLPTAPDTTGTGFIPVADLTSKVLLAIEGSQKYDGVMLWSKYYDVQTGYRSSIKCHVGKI